MTEAHRHLSGRLGNQDHVEFVRFVDLVRSLGVRRYLEIGCRNGDTFFDVMTAIGPGGLGMAVDLGENADTRRNLSGAAKALWAAGIRAHVVFGRSEEASTVESASALAPFDLILIDGDHTYDGVYRDWTNYARHAPVVAFHDVAAAPNHLSDGKSCGVPKFWDIMRVAFETEEIVTPGSNMGFGILYRERPTA